MLIFISMKERLTFYTNRITVFTLQQQNIKRVLLRLGTMRLIAFLAAVTAFYFFYKKGDYIFLIAAILFLLAFIFFIRKYADKLQEKALTEKLLFINQNELNILNGGENAFDDGAAFARNESYWGDLDIFGSKSVYHLLNRTTTVNGSQALAGLLKNPFTDKETIISAQQAIMELKEQTEQRQLFTANGLLFKYKDTDLEEVTNWLNEKEKLVANTGYRWARLILPVLSVSALSYWIITGNYTFFAALFILNLSLVGSIAKYTGHQHALIGKKQALLNQYTTLLKTFLGFRINQSPVLSKLQQTAAAATGEIKKLSVVSNFFDQRLNMLTGLLLNGVVLYDLQCLFYLEKWKIKNKVNFTEWTKALSEIECLNTLSTFACNNPTFCLPEVMTGQLFIEARELSHPLIQEKERVYNDFNIGKKEKLQLITGSNMSGKTTFLRSVGVNLLLAQCGAPVCATAMSFTPMQILSAIRVSDSLQEHTSYFMAELKKLQYIIEMLKTGQSSLVLIDEILRGTNSDDKSHGSAEFIKKILAFNALTLFATHDLSLGELAKNEYPAINNYCFESNIQNGELCFDYQLRKGIAQNKNASYLMQKMGII